MIYDVIIRKIHDALLVVHLTNFGSSCYRILLNQYCEFYFLCAVVLVFLYDLDFSSRNINILLANKFYQLVLDDDQFIFS